VSRATFLEYLRIAALKFGYPTPLDLFPDGTYDEFSLTASMKKLPVARITLGKQATTSSPDFGSLFRSDTNRDPHTATRVSAEQVSELSGLADGSGATLQFYSDATSRKTLGDFGVEGTLIETRYAASTAESDRLFSSTEAKKNVARSGAKRSIASTSAAMAATQAYAMISTAGNSRREQVEAGILDARFSLRARTLGLVMQPLSQVLQKYSSMSRSCAAIHEQFAPKWAWPCRRSPGSWASPRLPSNGSPRPSC
jgi:hypothetical protein